MEPTTIAEKVQNKNNKKTAVRTGSQGDEDREKNHKNIFN